MNKLLQSAGDVLMYILGVFLLSIAWALGAVLQVRRTVNGEKKVIGKIRWFKYRPVRSNKP